MIYSYENAVIVVKPTASLMNVACFDVVESVFPKMNRSSLSTASYSLFLALLNVFLARLERSERLAAAVVEFSKEFHENQTRSVHIAGQKR